MPRGPDRTALQALHVSIGAIAVLPILFRVFWRVREGFPAPLPGPRWQHLASRIVHWGLLVVLVGMAISGPLIDWTGRAGAVEVLGLFAIPSPIPASRGLHEAMEAIHATLARPFLLVFLAVHILAVLKHLVIDRDRTLARMVTGKGA